MARKRLRSPDQPWPLQALLWLYEACASLKLAVVLIFASAFVLGWATFVESNYGLAAVQFGVYGTWWFTLLNALLAVNIFCAAAIRFPWQRYQTGFVITHIGLLTLLFGCLLSRRDGIDAQMPVFEGKTNHEAYEDSQHFALTVHRLGQGHAQGAAAAKELPPIPFRAGVFNWQDYGTKIGPLPWELAARDRGVIYDQDGIRLEVLDYYADSVTVGVPYVKLKLSSPRMGQGNAAGPMAWSTIPLEIADSRDPRQRPFARQRAGGGQFVFWMANSPAETQAFLASRPDTELGYGQRGQVVLYVEGHEYRFQVDEHIDGGLFALDGDDGAPSDKYTAEVVKYLPTGIVQVDANETLKLVPIPGGSEPRNPAVEVKVYGAGEGTSRMVLFSDHPDLCLQAHDNEVFGTYWFDHGEKSAAELMQGQGGSRIDIVQSPDQKLHYRYWNRQEVAALEQLPTSGQRVDAFKMPIAQLQMYVEQYLPSDVPDHQILPLPFNKEINPRDAERAAHLRMTVDGNTKEFWLAGPKFDPFGFPPSALQQQMVVGNGRAVAINLVLDKIDVGYTVRLEDFERTLDPGTSTDRHFGSIIDLLDSDTMQVVNDNVEISMNAPIDFTDPYNGRKYRLFQEAFRGPFKPGDGVFEMMYPDATDRSPKAMTILTVNYDPGRGVKYMGCLLIVAGIATMFYMRAYFFKPVRRDKQPQAKQPKPQPVEEPVADGLPAHAR